MSLDSNYVKGADLENNQGSISQISDPTSHVELGSPVSYSSSEISCGSLDRTTLSVEGVGTNMDTESNRDKRDKSHDTINCSPTTTLGDTSTVSEMPDSSMDLSVRSDLESRHDNMDISVSSSGVMDVSHRSLISLPRKFRKEYGKVIKLNLAGNRIRSLSQMDMFKKCTMVDASDNQISMLSSFLPLSKHLTILNVSNNAISNVDCLKLFINLETFNASCNDILALPLLDNPVLNHIDLSSNSFATLPKFPHLKNLKYLNLSSNKITSLKNAETLSESLISLDISSNRISDLTEFMYLVHLDKLESIGAANNPCILYPTFNYRPYIVSVLPSLREIDTFSILEEEQLLGEWLYSQGKGRYFKPGCNNHLLLVSYLEKHCPVEPAGKLLSSFDKSLRKAIEKRREILNTSRTDDESSQSLSIHSPYRAWTNKLVTGGEKSSSHKTDDFLPITDSPKLGSKREEITNFQSVSMPSRDSQISFETSSTFPSSSSKSFSSVESLASSSTVTIVPTPTPRKSISNKNSGAWNEQTQKNLRKCIEETERETNRRDNVLERSHCHIESNAKVTDISMDMKQFIIRTNKKEKITMNEVSDRISVLEERMNQLSIENANLTKINDELSQLLVTMTNKFQEEVSSLRSEFQSIQPTIPIPTNLRVGRVLNEGCYEIIWDLPRVKGYKVLTNGVERGIVKAPNNAARISDLEQEIEHVIQLQVIDLDGRLGEISKSLVIPKAE